MSGKYIVRCLKPGGDTLVTYSTSADQGEEIDLLDPGTPDNIRAGGYWTAENMCCDLGFELAQKIARGDWAVIEKRQPQSVGG